MGSNESTANLAAVGAALGALTYWVLGLLLPAGAMTDLPTGALTVAVTWIFCRFVPPAVDPQARGTSAAVVGLIALVGLAGCTITRDKDGAFGLYPVSRAGDEVQTLTASNIGIEISGSSATGNGMPKIAVGYQRATLTRVPAFAASKVVPSVSATSRLDATTGARIEEALEVGTYLNEPSAP